MRTQLTLMGVCMMAIGVTVGMAGQMFAQYPLLPPESNGNANFEWRPELGGWLDRQANLVWGYGLTESLGGSYSYSGAQNAGSTYAVQLAAQVQVLLDNAAYYEAQALVYQETDPARSQRYAELAQWNRNSATGYDLAAKDAGQYTNWRIPTLVEFQTAWSRGLFSRGIQGFNMDMSPAEGYDGGYQNMNWAANSISKSKKTAIAFSLGDGGYGSIGVNSSINAQIVRTYTP